MSRDPYKFILIAIALLTLLGLLMGGGVDPDPTGYRW